LTALAAGVPLVITPIAADQPDNAAHAAAAGVGRVVEAADVTAERVRDAVAEVLREPAWRDRARAIAAEIAAMPAPEAVVGRLEALVRGG
jgi:UDP:flavonoid glycosyltransferase YjiC (YdhE family)